MNYTTSVIHKTLIVMLTLVTNVFFKNLTQTIYIVKILMSFIIEEN